MNPNTLYSALKRLETSTIIQQRSNNQATTITICNWWKYQQDVNNVSSHRRATVNTKQEKKEKENINIHVEQDKILTILNRVTGRNFTVEPRGIEKTKKAFTPEEIERALKNMYLDDWHASRMKTLSSDYLLRANVIDKFKDYDKALEKEKVDLTTVEIPNAQ